jgi:hypothetical protein
MPNLWVIILIIVVVAVAVAINRRRQEAAVVTRTTAATAEFQRPRDFAQEREDARREALGDAGRTWEDADVRQGTPGDDAGESPVVR